MPKFSYRYRPIHAICEKLFAGFFSQLPVTKGEPLGQRPNKVLVLKFGGMGEAILARSLVEHLRSRNPSMVFDFLVEPRTMETMTCGFQSNIFLYNPRTDGLVDALGILQRIRRSQYDAILDFEQCSILTASFAWATSIPVRLGFIPLKPDSREKLFTHPIKLFENESMWSAFLRLGRVLDPELPQSLSSVALPYSRETELWLSGWWNENIGSFNSKSVIALHIGVGPSAQYRCWPIDRFVALTEKLQDRYSDLTVILTGSLTEKTLIAKFREMVSCHTIDASSLGGIEQTAALLQRCNFLISNDTGVMHLGAAMGTPTVGVFGASNPIWWAPVGARATYVYKSRLRCSPCINSYQRQIPEKCIAQQQSACMREIQVDDVIEALRRVLEVEFK